MEATRIRIILKNNKMFYKTLRTSETGQKFALVSEQRKKCQEAAVKLAEKYEFSQWYKAHWTAFGGISAVIFDKEPQKKLWGKGDTTGSFAPKRNSKAGKAIYKDFLNLPTVSRKELNDCVDSKMDSFMYSIGFSWKHPEWYLFKIGENWDTMNIPEDCIEVTLTEYKKLSNHGNNNAQV